MVSAALALRPYRAKAWYYQGEVNRGWGRLTAAVAGCRRAPETDPMHGRAYPAIAWVLRDMEQEAVRYLCHGSRHTRNP